MFTTWRLFWKEEKNCLEDKTQHWGVFGKEEEYFGTTLNGIFWGRHDCHWDGVHKKEIFKEEMTFFKGGFVVAIER